MLIFFQFTHTDACREDVHGQNKTLKKAIKGSLRNIIAHLDSNDVTLFLLQEGVLTVEQVDEIEGNDDREAKVCVPFFV